jgi:hypothetical protein
MRDDPDIAWILEKPSLNIWQVCPELATRGSLGPWSFLNLTNTRFVGSEKIDMSCRTQLPLEKHSTWSYRTSIIRIQPVGPQSLPKNTSSRNFGVGILGECNPTLSRQF